MSTRDRTRGHDAARAPRRRPRPTQEPPTHELPPHLVSMKELSRYLQVSRSTLWKLVHAGQVPHYRVGHQYRFDVLAVTAVMDRFR